MKRYFAACFLGVLFAYSQAFSSDDSSQEECSYDNFKHLLSQDLSALEMQEVKLSGQSAEGGSAEVYRRQDDLVIIKSIFFGETGKTEIKYYFDLSNRHRYLVELTDYYYTVPIYFPGSKTAAVSINKFVVCEGQSPNYPDSVELRGAYSRSINILDIIRKNLTL